MFMMFAVSLNAQSLVAERTNGTLERLMTSRLTVNQLFVGKFLASSLRGAVQALVLLLLGFVAMRIARARGAGTGPRVCGAVRGCCERRGDS